MKKAFLAIGLLLLLLCGGCDNGPKFISPGPAEKRAVQEFYLLSNFGVEIYEQGGAERAVITMDGVRLTTGRETWTIYSSAEGIRIFKNGVPVYESGKD